MAAPAGAIETTSGYPIIDPDTINPREHWPAIQQAQADWIDTHTILSFPTMAALLIARPTMPPGQSGYAYVQDRKLLYRWAGTSWNTAAPWTQSGTASLGAVPANDSVADIFITFPVAFSSAGYVPTLLTSFQAQRVSLAVVARTASQLQVRVNNYTSTASSAGATIYWSATLMPGV